MTHVFLPSCVTAPLIQESLREDMGRGGDITSQAVIPPDAQARMVMKARQAGCIAGLNIARDVFLAVDSGLQVDLRCHDGDIVEKGDVLMEISGNARSILAAERVALNFAGRMSGIATLTRHMVEAVKPHAARIAATRKTTPTLRALEKYAVQMGGGIPHRYALDDMVMIKDNHIAVAGGVRPALEQARRAIGHTVKIEIEVDTLEQLKEVLEVGADIILLDNMSLADMRQAVAMVRGAAIVEASGNVSLDTVHDIAATGVDVISSGALTHSIRNFDIGLDALTL